MTAYYNEIDPFAAQWLRNLISTNLIAPGEVDERSIVDVQPNDLRGYTQCHFFAGIGVWSYALRRAGWCDDRPVWTGSCPCQPFSAAGKGAGFDDERHLWPHSHWLIEQCAPATVFGEQVASKDGLAWLDLVQADMEGADYAFGAVDTCAAGFGAPNIRQRLYWAADPLQSEWPQGRPIAGRGSAAGSDQSGGLANADGRHAGAERQQRGREQRQQPQNLGVVQLGVAASGGCERIRDQPAHGQPMQAGAHPSDPNPNNGFWQDADWLYCRDGKWRPVEPGSFPLAHGTPARVGRLRGYGNAINAAQAQGFIEAYLERG